MMCERSSATPTSEADLPTACYYLKSNYLLIVWCRACRHQSEMERKIIDQVVAMCRS